MNLWNCIISSITIALSGITCLSRESYGRVIPSAFASDLGSFSSSAEEQSRVESIKIESITLGHDILCLCAWPHFSYQDKGQTEFSTLDMFVCMPCNHCAVKQYGPILSENWAQATLRFSPIGDCAPWWWQKRTIISTVL